jgi:hypothetical protein
MNIESDVQRACSMALAIFRDSDQSRVAETRHAARCGAQARGATKGGGRAQNNAVKTAVS